MAVNVDTMLTNLTTKTTSGVAKWSRRDPSDTVEPYEYICDLSANVSGIRLDLVRSSTISILIMSHIESGKLAQVSETTKPAVKTLYDAVKAKDTSIRSAALASLETWLAS